MKNIMKEAHRLTREIKAEFPEVDYQAQLGICISYLYENEKKENVKMVELKGTEKQVKWAEDIRRKAIKKVMARKDYEYKEEVAKTIGNIESAEVLISTRDRYENDERFEKHLQQAKRFYDRKYNK